MSLLCEIFRSPRKAEMYLFVERAAGLDRVPEPLLAEFGEPEPVMTLVLSADRKLARADVVEVLASIEAQGFYLQLPPSSGELLSREQVVD